MVMGKERYVSAAYMNVEKNDQREQWIGGGLESYTERGYASIM